MRQRRWKQIAVRLRDWPSFLTVLGAALSTSAASLTVRSSRILQHNAGGPPPLPANQPQTAKLIRSCLNRSSSSVGMRHRRQTRIAVMLRDAHSARIVFGASFSCAAASSVVRRFESAGPSGPSVGRDADFMGRCWQAIRMLLIPRQRKMPSQSRQSPIKVYLSA